MTGADIAANPLAARVRAQLAELYRLAWPTMIARAGILTMALVDVAMVGRYDTAELAYASLGTSLFVPLLVTGVGLMIGVIAVTAQTFGAGREADCGIVWLRALPFAGVVGAASALVCVFGETWLTLFGQTPELAREGGRVAVALAPGLFAYTFFVASTFFLEGIRRPGPGMVAMLAANLLNIALNWVFIYGNLGAPAMGAVGSAVTTSVVRAFLAIALVVYILRMTDRARFGIGGVPRLGDFSGWWRDSARQRRIGYAGGASIGLETSAHSALIQFAGLLGVVPLAAYTIAANVEAVLFMAALGIGGATAVLVGNAWGRGDVSGARLAGWVGVAATLATMALFGALVALLRHPIAQGYTPDPVLAAAAAPLLILVGVAIIADGASMTAAQAVRGLGDTWNATLRYGIAFWGVMVPLGWWLGVSMGYGTAGLLCAVGIGCLTALLLQSLRFSSLLRRGVS